jgi:hypothetical protein
MRREVAMKNVVRQLFLGAVRLFTLTDTVCVAYVQVTVTSSHPLYSVMTMRPTHPSTQWIPATVHAGHEANHTPPYTWWCLMKQQVYHFFLCLCLLEPGYFSGIALGYGLDDRGFESRQGLGLFIFTASRPVLGPTQPPIQWVTGALSLAVKWPGCEADPHLHLVSRSRMRGAIPPLPSTPLWRGDRLKHRDNFTFLCLLNSFGRNVKLDAHLQLMPRLRMRGAIPPLGHTSSWCDN